VPFEAEASSEDPLMIVRQVFLIFDPDEKYFPSISPFNAWNNCRLTQRVSLFFSFSTDYFTWTSSICDVH
jgi:hypothetical protein